MRTLLLGVLYITHFFFMLGGIAFAILYFTLGPDFLAEGLEKETTETVLSFRWWQIIVAVIYPLVMFLGVHLLYKRSTIAPAIYATGCAIYVISNAASVAYAYVANLESIAKLEDLGFSILFVCIAWLVYKLSKWQASREAA